MKVGILRETRRWRDRRVAITPETAVLIRKNYPNVEVFVQSSQTRAYTDEEYRKAGIPVVGDVSDCDLLIGVKEVAEDALVAGKTHVMFAHVAKKQSHNQDFLKVMAEKKITLIDYEYFTGKKGNRLVAFGFWAGVVGTYYAFRGIAKRFLQLEIPGPEQCYDLNELHHQLKKVEWPAIKIVITGGGRVSSGALEIINQLGIREVLPHDFLHREFDHPVFVRLDPQDYVKRTKGEFNLNHFFQYPKEYKSAFLRYTKVADVFIPCHFWNQDSPVFFTEKNLKSSLFGISLIADISCDVAGPIPSTIRTSSIEEPFYDIDPTTLTEKSAFSSPSNVTVMAVDNLPAALPIDASRTFARDLYEFVFPSLFGDDHDGIIERATILKDGQLTPQFSYLSDFLED
ncbi:MAG TPA: NAD(P)-dependent oxidoreductase [Sunxiuqinia sp.]|nr:NAD(P)-dependent oxidoreductase [Sunxiuqinia sp.]